MSSEQEPVVAPESAPGRRRIIVAPKLADKPKPLALIVRDPELQEEFEEQLNKARPVVVFPSLTHFCSDSLPTNWGGVVVARACGFDARLMSFVPNTTCIAFWQVAEEGYGWPSDISHLRNAEDLSLWLNEIAKPQIVIPLKRVEKRVEKRIVTRPKPDSAPKTPFKFELAVARGTVVSKPTGQMELSGLDKSQTNVEKSAKSDEGVAASRPTSQPPAAKSDSKPSARKGRKSRPEQLKLPVASAAQKRSDARAERDATARRQAIKRQIIAESAGSSQRAEQAFLRLAAELGLVHADTLVRKLRAHAKTVR